MGILTAFTKRAAGGWLNTDSFTGGWSSASQWGWAGQRTHSGQTITRQSALTLSVVYGCVSLISSRIAAMPVDIIGGPAGQTQPRWVENPSPEMSRIDLISCAVMSLLLDGNAFIAVRRRRGRPIELAIIDPYRVTLTRQGGDFKVMIDGQDFTGETMTIRHIVMPGDLRGLSPLAAAAQIMGLGLGAQEQAAAFFSKGAVVPGVIETEGDMTADQMRELRDQWVKTHGGTAQAHLPVVMGRAKWQSVSITNEQAQFLETRKFTDTQICSQVFHIDPTLMGVGVEGKSLTYQTVESRNRQLYHDALMPIMVRLEEAFSRLLPPGQRWKFNVDSLLRADLPSRYQSYQIAAQIQQMLGTPLLTVDEMRDLEDLPARPNPTPVMPDTDSTTNDDDPIMPSDSDGPPPEDVLPQ